MSAEWDRRDAGIAMLFTLLAAATRWPLSGRTLGEPDGARYALGLEQWLRAGPQAALIYGKVLSPGYYALAAALARWTGAGAVSVADAISLTAAIVSAPLIYWLGRRLTGAGRAALPRDSLDARPGRGPIEPQPCLRVWCGRVVAATGAALFLLAPGFWWLGIEPHPQGASFCCLLIALVLFLSVDDWRGEAGAAVLVGAGLLLKNDLVLVFGMFPALRLWKTGPGRWRRAVRSLWVPAAASAMFLAGRSWILGMALPQAQQQTMAAVDRFARLPHGVTLFKQVLPMVTTTGGATTAVMAAGLALGLGVRGRAARAWRARWGWLLLGWSAPATVFWFLIHGNDTRHMAPVVLVPLLAAVDAIAALAPARWRRFESQARWRGRGFSGIAAATLVLALVAMDAYVPPASSNTTLFPSGNVPGSVADLAARSQEMRTWLETSLVGGEGNPGAPCFLGNPTLPYLELDLVRIGGHRLARPLNGVGGRNAQAMAIKDGRGTARFIEVNSAAGDIHAARQCRHEWRASVRSLEYTSGGMHRRFLGREWTWLPLARRWYPATR